MGSMSGCQGSCCCPALCCRVRGQPPSSLLTTLRARVLRDPLAVRRQSHMGLLSGEAGRIVGTSAGSEHYPAGLSRASFHRDMHRPGLGCS